MVSGLSNGNKFNAIMILYENKSKDLFQKVQEPAN